MVTLRDEKSFKITTPQAVWYHAKKKGWEWVARTMITKKTVYAGQVPGCVVLAETRGRSAGTCAGCGSGHDLPGETPGFRNARNHLRSVC